MEDEINVTMNMYCNLLPEDNDTVHLALISHYNFED